MLGHCGFGTRPEEDLETQIGQSLGQQALRGPNQEDRLLFVPSLANQPHLLAGVLGVVAGVGLVGHEVGNGRAQHREVGVDGHPAGQPALVVVEPRPGLVGDQFPFDMLTLREAEKPIGALAEVIGQRVDDWA